MNRSIIITGLFSVAVLSGGCSGTLRQAAVGTIDHYADQLLSQVKDRVDDLLAKIPAEGPTIAKPQSDREYLIYAICAAVAGNFGVVIDRRFFHRKPK